ncbi:AAA family ATPase [Cellulomonas sp. PS-H5]|uniref:McrB family protein n=1 Tax=Cellulomonas sp. PS-H5 TaxID=2820400 RepID=UPI001C4F425E|nr:AAA family ATPase [Cellulomonas sp. PS-H5]MBW0252606.1 AAA family ATPase [Cellulomonas sp. PS-H5]
MQRFIASRGFSFDPWQVAAYVTAVRTKPFVILAGVSGTGKSALPRLVAQATGGVIHAVPVRPDWSDSSDLLGYQGLDGTFRPGSLLRVAADAQLRPTEQFFFLLDEMNIARPEYYLAEVLSRIEETGALLPGGTGNPLRPDASGEVRGGLGWDAVVLPPNLTLVGSVNMDETTFGFSRKILDRAFVIEFSDVDLSRIGDAVEIAPTPAMTWNAGQWARDASTLAEHPARHEALVGQVISTLVEINEMLAESQLHFGYRVRDEIALFCLAAQESEASFQTADGGQIDALDLAISMKVLPRIQGSGSAVGRLLEMLSAWASPVGAGSRGFPVSAERIELMRDRLTKTGFTNYWL